MYQQKDNIKKSKWNNQCLVTHVRLCENESGVECEISLAGVDVETFNKKVDERGIFIKLN